MRSERLGDYIGHCNSLQIRSYQPESEADLVDEIKLRIAMNRKFEAQLKEKETCETDSEGLPTDTIG
jgi:hypothetical protein